MQGLAQGLDDRDAAGRRGLEAQRHAPALGERRQRQPVLGEQRLVRRDDVMAGGERGLDRVLRGAVAAADELDDAVDLPRAREIDRIVEPGMARDVDAARLGPVARRDRRDPDRAAAALGERVVLARKDPHHRRADRAEAGDADAKGLQHALVRRAGLFRGSGRHAPIWQADQESGAVIPEAAEQLSGTFRRSSA